MAVSIATGTQTSVVTTEHTLTTDTTNRRYQLVVDMSNLAAGDTVEIRIYTKAVTGGTSRVAGYYVFSNAQGEPNKHFPIFDCRVEFKATLKQTAGSARDYYWEVLDPQDDYYEADVDYRVDATNTRDEYNVRWYKNRARVTSGITSPTVQVVKRSDGTDLITSTAMTQVASTGWYKYDTTTAAARQTAGETYEAIVTATIDSATRTFARLVGRDV